MIPIARLGAAAGVQFATVTENAELSARAALERCAQVGSDFGGQANSELAVQLGTFDGCAVDHPTTWRTA
jgi:hypothetical protein